MQRCSGSRSGRTRGACASRPISPTTRGVPQLLLGGGRAELDGLPGGRGLNIAHEAVDRHAAGPRAERVALRWLGSAGARARAHATRSCATATQPLRERARGRSASAPGERVFALAGRDPRALRRRARHAEARSVFCPLFSAFGPEPIRQRLALGDGRVLVTTRALYRRKVAGAARRAAATSSTCCSSASDGAAHRRARHARPRARSCEARRTASRSRRPTPRTLALLHFTSGTTGTPKGAVHVHDAVVAHHATGRSRSTSTPTTSSGAPPIPGWVTGTSYGIVAPLTHGVTQRRRRGRLRRRALVPAARRTSG